MYIIHKFCVYIYIYIHLTLEMEQKPKLGGFNQVQTNWICCLFCTMSDSNPVGSPFSIPDIHVRRQDPSSMLFQLMRPQPGAWKVVQKRFIFDFFLGFGAVCWMWHDVAERRGPWNAQVLVYLSFCRFGWSLIDLQSPSHCLAFVDPEVPLVEAR